jgi:hypothetical protein
MLNVTFVTLMYGMGLPLLFPIALMTFVVLYLMERLLLTYYYKKPPMYSDILNKSSIELIPYAVILQMFFGYWMLSNLQIFTNKVGKVEKQTDVEPTGHEIGSSISLDQALPLFGAGCLIFLIVVFGSCLKGCLRCFCPKFREEREFFVEEGLHPYFNSLPENEAKWWIAEEKHIRD